MTEIKHLLGASAPAEAPRHRGPESPKPAAVPQASASSQAKAGSTASAPQDRKSHDVAKKAGALAILSAMGPGLLTAFAGNDAGGIATYSTTGASYGFGMLWTVPLMCILLIVVQETAARMG